MKFLAGLPLLVIVLGLGIWLTLSGLQALISPSSSSLGDAWLWVLPLGLLCFIGGIVSGVLLLSRHSHQ